MNKIKAKISIIIPVINEEKIIEKCLSQFKNKPHQELIIVDGGSTDNTIQLIKKNGFNIIESDVKNRGYQLNLGAKKSQANILLFLHADTILPNNYLQIINDILEEDNVILGAFSLQIDDQKKSFRLVEKIVNWRSKFFSLPYGDQGIFIKKSAFEKIGGFPDMPIMEDFAFIKIVQKKGLIKISNEAVITSARRWQKLGIFKTTIINQLMIMGFYLGIDINKLANFYRNQK